jgi:hypothetical protein
MFVSDDPLADVGSVAGGPAGIQVQVTARVETAAGFAELGRAWLVGARERLAGELWHRLDAGVPSVTGGVLRSGVPSLGRFQWSADYSPENFDLLLSSLGEQRGEYAEWMIDDLENDDPESCSSADCGLQADERWDRRVVLRAGAWFNRSAVPAAVQKAFVDFLSEFSERAQASFGNATDDNDRSQTALEMVLPGSPDDGVLRSDEVLRGYSWVTVCPPAVVERLGGYDALASTGAFLEVRRLGYGAALLRATELLEHYDSEAIRRVFRALSPALPPGKPRPLPDDGGQFPPRIVYEDASEAGA